MQGDSQRGIASTVLAALLAALAATSASAGDAAAERAAAWLREQVQLDGTLASESTSIAEPAQQRAEALRAIVLIEAQSPPPALVSRVAEASAEDLEHLARALTALPPNHPSIALLQTRLRALQQPDGGFGLHADSGASTALDSALALQALAIEEAANTPFAQLAIGYLASVQSNGGGFAVNAEDRVYVTALALAGLDIWRQRFEVSASAEAASAWLLAQRQAGHFASVLEDSVALLAFKPRTLDAAILDPLTAALRDAQLANGSWNNDPFTTALAARALWLEATPPPPATTASLEGGVADASTNLPLANVTLALVERPESATTSRADGTFELRALPPGSYTLRAGRIGYATQLIPVTLAAGQVLRIGTIRLAPSPLTAAMSGIVRDPNGTPVPDAVIAVATATASTNSLGEYQLTNINSGSALIVVSRIGFQTLTQEQTFTAGQNYVFSPTLYPEGQPPPDDASATGTIIDAETSAPIEGAVVVIGARSATSDSTGVFFLDELPPGDTTIAVSAAGYQSATFTAALAAGANSIGTLGLSRPATTSSLRGRVLDFDSAAAIVNAQVTVVGTGLAATSDASGNYVIEGIANTSFQLMVEAAGYVTARFDVSLPQHGAAVLDLRVAPETTETGISFREVRTSKPVYSPYDEFELEVEAFNATANPSELIVDAVVIDAEGRVAFELKANARGLGQNPPNLPIAIPANAIVEVEMERILLRQAAGEYTVRARGFDASGRIIAQGTARFDVRAEALLGGGLIVDPPLAQAGTGTRINFDAELTNLGNQPIPAGEYEMVVTLVVADPQSSTAPVTSLRTLFSGSPLDQTVGMRVDDAGNIYVANAGAPAIIRVTPEGAASIAALLPAGHSLVDLARTADGTLWAAGNDNHFWRIDPNGAQTEFASTEVNYLTGIDLESDGDLILVGSAGGNSRLVRRSAATGQETVLSSGGLASPKGLLRNTDGSYLVSNRGNNTISMVSAQGAESTWMAGLDRPAGLVRDASGILYVANSGDGTVQRIAPNGARSTHASGLVEPGELAIDATGDLLVASELSSTILRVAPDGSSSTYAVGIADGPQAMVEDVNGNLYIASSDGRLTRKTINDEVTVVTTALSLPSGMTFDGKGGLLVTSLGTNVVQRVAADGAVTVFKDELLGPKGVARNTQGDVLVTENYSDRISRLDADGNLVSRLESLVNNPTRLRRDSSGRLYALNSGYVTVREAGVTRKMVRDVYFQDILPDGTGSLVGVSGRTVQGVTPQGVVSELAQLPFTFYGGLARAPDGALLIADNAGQRIARLEADNSVVDFALLDGTIADLAQAPNGQIFALLDSTRIVRVAVDGTSTGLAELSGVYSLGISDDGRPLVIISGSSGLELQALDPVTGAATLLIAEVPAPSGIAMDLAGEITLSDAGGSALVEYANGVEIRRLSGFSSPGSMVWAGSEFRFVDGTSLYSMQAGSYPVRLAAFPATSLFLRAGETWGVSGSFLLRWDGSSAQYSTIEAGSTLTAGVGRNDGTAVVADEFTSSVSVLDAANAVTRRFAGLVGPIGMAFDALGRLHVANRNGSVARFGPGGTAPSLVASRISGLQDIAFNLPGVAFVTHSGSVSRLDPDTGVTELLAYDPNLDVRALSADGGRLMMTEGSASQLRELNGSSLDIFSAGISSASAVRVEDDGGILIASRYNNSVLRFESGALALAARDLNQPLSLATRPDGGFVVAGSYGSAHQVSAEGTIESLRISALLPYGAGVSGVGVRQDGSIVVGERYSDTLFELTITQAPPAPQPGAVLHRETRSAASLPGDGATIAVDFGSWLPPFAGDFNAEVTRAGITGQASNFVHVGPFATGELTVLGNRTPPGDQSVPLRLQLTGADFTSVSRVETAQFRRLVYTSFPGGMIADRSGNIFYTETDRLIKVSPDGQASPVLTDIAPRFGLAIDGAENLYLPVSQTSGTNSILRVAPDGTSSVLADLGTTPTNGVAVDSRDDVLVGTVGALLRVDRDSGQVTTVAQAGISSPLGIAVDGSDNVYVQNSDHHVSQIFPDGSARTIFANANGIDQPIFEGDGYPTITADCADNFYITAFQWERVGQVGEEHILSQVVPRTGNVAGLLDVTRVDPNIGDIDYLSFDRFGNRILMWDHSTSAIYSVPVTCGAISVEAHVIARAGETLSGFDRAPSAVLALADGRTEYVWSLRDITSGGFALNFDADLEGLQLGETRPVADSAFLLFRNTFVAADVRVPLRVPGVTVENLLSIDIATDAAEYVARSNARITTTMDNPNALPVSGELRVSVLDATGQVVGTLATQSLTLAPAAQTQSQGDFPIGTIVPGNYVARASFVDVRGESSRAETGFRVLADNATASARAELQLDRALYDPDDRVQITSRAVNQSANVILANLVASLRIYDPANVLLQTTHHQIAQLLPGSIGTFADTQVLASAPAGQYRASLSLTDAENRVLDQRDAIFSVRSSSDTGAGLSATLVADPATAPRGTPVALAATLRNSGNADFTALAVRVFVIDLEDESTVASWASEVNVARNGQVPLNQVWATGNAPAGAYAAVVVATIAGNDLPLARVDINLTVPTIDVDLAQSVDGDTRVLALRFCKSDGLGTSAPSCRENPTRQFLDTYLTSLGVIHKVVDSVEVFRRELRSGRWNTYWLSGGYPLLRDAGVPDPGTPGETRLSLELSEAVFRGQGLILDGRVDWRHATATAPLGVRYTTRLTGADLPITVADTDVFDVADLRALGRGLVYESAGATVHARFGSSAQAGEPAIFTHRFGAGQSVLFGFDFVAMLAAQPQSTAQIDVLDRSFSHARPPLANEFSTGGYVPFVTTVANRALPLSLAARVTAPPGIAIESTDPAADESSADSVTWRFDLDQDQSRDFDAGLRIGEPVVPAVVRSRVSRVVGTAETLLSEQSYELPVRTYAQWLQTARDAVESLAVTDPSELDARTAALARIQLADVALSESQFENAIGELLAARDQLLRIQSVAIGPARSAVAELLRIAEFRWYQANPGP